MLQDGGGRLAQLVLRQVGHAGVAGALLGRVGAAGGVRGGGKGRVVMGRASKAKLPVDFP